MSDNQKLKQKKDIDSFKKAFYENYGIKVYVYSPTQKKKIIPIKVFHDSALAALHEAIPGYSCVKSLHDRTRYRDYMVYVQSMSYLAFKGGHSKSSIGKYLQRTHATIINSCNMVENGFFTKDKTILIAYNNTLKKLEEYVGTISENDEGKNDTKPKSNPIWDETRGIVA